VKFNKTGDALAQCITMPVCQITSSLFDPYCTTPFVPSWHDDVWTEKRIWRKTLSLSLSLSLFLARSFISAPSHAESAPNQKTRTPRERHTISGHCHGRIRMPTLRHSETSLRPVKIRLIPFFLLFYADACCRGRAAAVTEKSDDSSKRRYTRLRIQNTHTHTRARTHTHTRVIYRFNMYIPTATRPWK